MTSGRTIYAYTFGAHAVAEATALCSWCRTPGNDRKARMQAAFFVEDLTADGPDDCTGDESLSCQVCGWPKVPAIV